MRLSRLSAEASKLARAGAVLQRGFDFESVMGVTGRRSRRPERVRRAVERHLVQEEPAVEKKRRRQRYTHSATYSSPTRR